MRGQPGGEKFGYPVSKQVVSEVLSEIWLEGAELLMWVEEKQRRCAQSEGQQAEQSPS